MSEFNRPVREVVYLIDVDDEPPNVGDLVFALGLGGKLVETVWTRDSHQFFLAWMPYPKTPKSVKAKLMKQYVKELDNA